jgi:hypothetical protein
MKDISKVNDTKMNNFNIAPESLCEFAIDKDNHSLAHVNLRGRTVHPGTELDSLGLTGNFAMEITLYFPGEVSSDDIICQGLFLLESGSDNYFAIVRPTTDNSPENAIAWVADNETSRGPFNVTYTEGIDGKFDISAQFDVMLKPGFKFKPQQHIQTILLRTNGPTPIAPFIDVYPTTHRK